MARITKEDKAKWIEDLRSGKYRQTKRQMSSPYGAFCCLGVLRYHSIGTSSEGMDKGSIFGSLLTAEETDELMKLNDTDNKTFPEIADWIEEHVEVA